MPVVRAKSAPKAEHVASDLRESILDGRMPPGTRLPVRPELEQMYSVSWTTLQKAVDLLRRDGFIESRGRRGTYVASMPPHLHRYGLVFQVRQKQQQSRFWSSLQQVAMEGQSDEQARKLAVYYHHSGDPRSADYQELVQDVERQRVAGLIFVGVPFGMEDSPVLTQPGLPRVGIMQPWGGIPSVYLDPCSFWQRAVEYCKSRGRRRIGIVTFLSQEYDMSSWQPNQSVLDRAGVETHPHWTLFFEGMRSVANPVNLLMQLPADQRPDALIIGDDNLVEQAMAGIVASGVSVPEEVELVVHCNFPNPPPTVLPARRLGLDCSELMQVCCDIIDRQRRDEDVPGETVISSLFEEESSGQNTSRIMETRYEAVQSRLYAY